MIKSSLQVLLSVRLLHFCFCQSAKQHFNRQVDSTSSLAKLYFATMANSSIFRSKDEILLSFNKVVPPLSNHLHKGQSGRVGIVGGSEEYTGAPYFAGISALKVGADLSHIICAQSASQAIKSYSPELIVHPLLDKKDGFQSIKRWVSRLHAVVVGPGLGLDPEIHKTVENLIALLISNNIPVVIDADGLSMVTKNPKIIHGYKKAILTPNAVEFDRLFSSMKLEQVGGESKTKLIEETIALSKALGDVTIVRKGANDVIAKGNEVAVVEEAGSPRRCGGQGDLLSGAMNVFAYWAFKNQNELATDIDPTVVAAFAASVLTRRCAREAFAKHHRSTTTTDLINEIEFVFQKSKL